VTFKGKTVKVILAPDAKDEYDSSNMIVSEASSKGIKKSGSIILLNSINQKIDFLKLNPEYGIHIPKDRIPKEYVQKYDLNNLWKINLSGAWRMLYTLRGSEVEIISLIVDIINHQDYDKKFGYRRK